MGTVQTARPKLRNHFWEVPRWGDGPQSTWHMSRLSGLSTAYEQGSGVQKAWRLTGAKSGRNLNIRQKRMD